MSRVTTFGCRLNLYESAVIEGHLAQAGPEAADVLVVNTCAVTADAERQARQGIRRLKRENPDARILVTGCAAQIAPESWAAMPEVAGVIGNAEKLSAETWAALAPDPAGSPTLRIGDIMTVRETAPHLTPAFQGRTRAFLQVQNGCDHRCTFCIIPYGRGPARSVPIGRIVAEAQALIAEGFTELVLTGVDLTSYGPDLPGQPRLGQMLRRLLALVPELRRLRLSSLDPAEIDPDLWHLIAEEPRLMPHLHLSMQAGSDLILKRMKRRHLRADLLAVMRRMLDLRPDCVFGVDVIAGFPTETEAHAAETLAVLTGMDRILFAHVFPYSARTGTPAAKMPQVPLPARKARAAALRAAGEANLRAWMQARIGQTAEILIEQDGMGRTPHYVPLRLDPAEPAAASGTYRLAEITGFADQALLGRSLLPALPAA